MKYDDPALWDRRIDAWRQRTSVAMEQYVRYVRWFRGDMADVEKTVAARLPRRARTTLVNLTNLVTRTARAELFFRCPRFVVRPSGSLHKALFTSGLARTETALLNHTAIETDLYREGRKALIDGLLGPFFVFKIGYAAQVGIDTSAVEEQKLLAREEDQKFVAAGIRPRLRDDDLDAVHYEQHDQTIAASERGAINLPRKALDYLRKHRDKHKDRLDQGLGRPSETVRAERVFLRRRNPLNVYFDPHAEGPADREWCGENYLARIEEVQQTKEFSSKARDGVIPVTSRWSHLGRFGLPTESVQAPDEYCLLNEVVDLVNQKVITYAQGGKEVLGIKDWTLGAILPSGPYVDASFMEDPLEDQGIPPPAAFEAHQIAASYIASINTTAVKRSVPKIAFDASVLSPQDIEEIRRGLPGGMIPLKRLAPGMKVSDVIQQIPPAEVPAQNLQQLLYHERKIEQYSGLGSSKLAGGDFSRTATASALIGESVATMSEDLASVVDDVLGRLGRFAERLNRKFLSRYQVSEIVGDEALDAWPDTWAQRDIVNDRGILVIPGSSRRNNNAVEQQLLQGAYGLVAADPLLPPAFRMEVLRRVLESMGLFGFDYEGVDQAMVEQEVLARLTGGGAEGPGAPPGASGGRESSEPSRAAMLQGMANVGGGRMRTGASEGDRPRFFRKGPTGRTA